MSLRPEQIEPQQFGCSTFGEMASREIMQIPGLTLFLQIEGPLRLIVGDGPKAECFNG